MRRIEAAEQWIAAAGCRVVRVRDDGGAARVEVEPEAVARLAARWHELAPPLLRLGFTGAHLDPLGYRRGGADLPRPERRGLDEVRR